MLVANLIAASFWLIFSLAVVYAGYDLGLGELVEPGPGFMLFWIGLAMTGLAFAVLMTTWRTRMLSAGQSFSGQQKWAGIVVVIILLTLYVWLLPILGFALLTLLFLLALFRLIDPLGWRSTIMASILVTGGNYLVFDYWLGTQLPLGSFVEWAMQWTY